MRFLERPFRDRRAAWAAHSIAAAAFAVALSAAPAASDAVPFQPRAGLDLARAAAQSWAPDAQLVYIENDEGVDTRGAAERWGYLFFSPTLDKARGYSVRAGKIVVAENLEMNFEAPPIAGEWIDSEAAIQVAERGVGRTFRDKHQGRLATMLLMRGAFLDSDPDETTWTLIYTAPHQPSLFVVVGATDGKVRRTWRG